MAEVRIEYIRPGKDRTIFVEQLVSLDTVCLKTYKTLPPEVEQSLTRALVADGLIAPHQHAVSIAKTYFFQQNFDLLEFYDQNGGLLGYYSDIGTPLASTRDGFTMTDWFLDLWLDPHGRMLELDVDEFEEAVAQKLLSRPESDQARRTFDRLIEEVNKGIYPHAYR